MAKIIEINRAAIEQAAREAVERIEKNTHGEACDWGMRFPFARADLFRHYRADIENDIVEVFMKYLGGSDV